MVLPDTTLEMLPYRMICTSCCVGLNVASEITSEAGVPNVVSIFDDEFTGRRVIEPATQGQHDDGLDGRWLAVYGLGLGWRQRCMVWGWGGGSGDR